MSDGPLYRSDNEVAEYRLTHAERAGWRIMDTLPEKIREQLFGMLEQDSEMPRD